MRAIIVGAGEVGFHIADRLAREGHAVTLIESDPAKEARLRDKVNALVLRGSGVSPDVLERAQVEKAGLFIAVTNADEVNLVACLLAHEYGVPRKIARIRSLDYGDDTKLSPSRLGIDLMINPQSVVADEIVNAVAYTSASEVAEFADGRVVFIGYPIGEGSPLDDVSLRELGGLRGMYRLVVTALARGGETVIPRGDDVIQAGDTVYFLCNKTDLPAIRYLFGLEKERARRVFVLGGGRVGRLVAERLARSSYRVTIVDSDPERCEELARDLEDVQVLNALGTEVEALKEEGLDAADVFVAVTNDDKTNILCALLARNEGAQRVAALVNDPQFIRLAPSLGIDACISPRLATAAAILKHVRRADVLSLAMLEQGSAEVVELSVHESPELTGRPLAEMSVPDGAIVGVIVRGDEVIIPSGSDHLEDGDRVVVFTLPDAVARVERFFTVE